MHPHRRIMDPSTLEMLVQLRYNRDLWDEKEVDDIMTRTQSAHVMELSFRLARIEVSVNLWG